MLLHELTPKKFNISVQLLGVTSHFVAETVG